MKEKQPKSSDEMIELAEAYQNAQEGVQEARPGRKLKIIRGTIQVMFLSRKPYQVICKTSMKRSVICVIDLVIS